MKNANLWIARTLITVVAVVLCGGPELAQAQAEQTAEQGARQQAQPGTVDPSRGPLAPVPTENLPSAAPQNSGDANPTQPTDQPGQKTNPKTVVNPLGTATAETGPTAGGAASRPAGNAIAPAKQRQTRSLLLKMGLIAAAGIAVGAVVGLSRGTHSTPPGTTH
jgi:hypothetical protein